MVKSRAVNEPAVAKKQGAAGAYDETNVTGDETRVRVSEVDGSRDGAPREETEGSRKREEERGERARKSRPKTTKKAVGGSGEAKGKQVEPKTVPVNVRLSVAMLEAVDKAISASPIEFGDRSEFIRRAMESELRRRGLLPTYK